jgi:hypothetical protein
METKPYAVSAQSLKTLYLVTTSRASNRRQSNCRLLMAVSERLTSWHKQKSPETKKTMLAPLPACYFTNAESVRLEI